MYLGTKPPSKSNKYKYKDEYHNTLINVISAETAPVRRIVFLSDGTKKWIKDLAKKYEGKTKTSLYIIKGDHFDMSISVQLFNSSSIVLMNFDNTHGIADYSDIIVETEDEVFLVYLSHTIQNYLL
jgi:hypothetical protein